MYGKGHLLLTAFVFVASAFHLRSIVRASTFPAQTQYLGTQNHGNEQVLLFKLPSTISTKLQSHLQQQQGTQDISFVASQSMPDYYYQQPQQQQQQPLLQLQQDSPDPQEQSISLTIPLSSLRIGAPTDLGQSEVSGYSPQQAASAGRYLMSDSRALSPDYLTTEESRSYDGRLQEKRPYNEPSQQYYLHQQQEEAQQKQMPAQTSNMTAAIAHQVRLLLQQQQQQQQQQADYATTGSPLIATTIEPNSYEPPRQPILWRDSINSQLPHAQTQPQAQENPDTTPITTHHHNQLPPHEPQPHHDASSLLARLANSSPDLLIRLKSLVRQATQRRLPNSAYSDPASSNSSTSSAEYYSVPGTATTDTNQEAGGGYLKPAGTHYNRGAAAQLGENMLNTFLTSHNDNSKPSYTNYTSNNNNTNGTRIIKLAINQPANNNYTAESSSLNPYVFVSNDNRQYSSQLETTTSDPQHTMAPYARQFPAPLATPYVRQYSSYQPADSSSISGSSQGYPHYSRQLTGQKNRTNDYTETPLISIVGGQYINSQTRPSMDSMIVGRSNATDSVPSSVASAASASASAGSSSSHRSPTDVNLQIHFVGQRAQESPNVHRSAENSNQMLSFAKQPPQPSYEIQLQNEQDRYGINPMDQPISQPLHRLTVPAELHYAETRPRLRMYSNPANSLQQQSRKPLVNSSDFDQAPDSKFQMLFQSSLRPGQVPTSVNLTSEPPTNLKPSYLDEGLSRFKPLFHVEQRVAQQPSSSSLVKEPQQYSSDNKPQLTHGQMLDLLARSGQLQVAGTRRYDQGRSLSPLHSSPFVPKKPPKMLLMIV